MTIAPYANSRHQCVLVPPAWRLSVLVLIYVVLIVLLLAGYDLPTALAGTSGAGLAAAQVVRHLFVSPHAGESR